MTSTQFSTAMFEWTHGKKPRGYGWWMFENRATGEVVEFPGNYSEAKRACAKAHPGQSFKVCA